MKTCRERIEEMFEMGIPLKDAIVFVKEHEHLRKTRIPRCLGCKTNFVRISTYDWKPNCNHTPSLRLSIG